MFVADVTTSAEDVDELEFGFSPKSHARRRAILRSLWDYYPTASAIYIVERGKGRQSYAPRPDEVVYVMPHRRKHNRRVEVRVGELLQAIYGQWER